MPQPSPCKIFSVLLKDSCVATEDYCRATAALVKVAGTHHPEAYADAKRECVRALGECKRTKNAITRHRRHHGC